MNKWLGWVPLIVLWAWLIYVETVNPDSLARSFWRGFTGS